MRDKYGVDQDPNCYPNSHTLINLLDLKTESELEEAEYEFTSFRLEQFEPDFSYLSPEYLQEIHQFLFQDIYSWAGKVRTVDISKGDTRFCTVARIEKETNKLFLSLENKNCLQYMTKDEFVTHIADFFCELNVIHPFREGNGRTSRLFCEVLALKSGFELSWKGITRNNWLAANINGYLGDIAPLIKIFNGCTQPIQ